jgi:hypothetical protein
MPFPVNAASPTAPAWPRRIAAATCGMVKFGIPLAPVDATGPCQNLRCSCAPLTAALPGVRAMAGPPILARPAARGAPRAGVLAAAFTLVTAAVANFEAGGLAWPNLALRAPRTPLSPAAFLADPAGWPEWPARPPCACAIGCEWRRSGLARAVAAGGAPAAMAKGAQASNAPSSRAILTSSTLERAAWAADSILASLHSPCAERPIAAPARPRAT